MANNDKVMQNARKHRVSARLILAISLTFILQLCHLFKSSFIYGTVFNNSVKPWFRENFSGFTLGRKSNARNDHETREKPFKESELRGSATAMT